MSRVLTPRTGPIPDYIRRMSKVRRPGVTSIATAYAARGLGRTMYSTTRRSLGYPIRQEASAAVPLHKLDQAPVDVPSHAGAPVDEAGQ